MIFVSDILRQVQYNASNFLINITKRDMYIFPSIKERGE